MRQNGTEPRSLRVLALNCGSSSLKYRLLCMPQEAELASGEARRLGPRTLEPPEIVHRHRGKVSRLAVPLPDHAAAFQHVMAFLKEEADAEPDAIGHRIVHGGEQFTEPCLVTQAVLRRLEGLAQLAPLHNPPAIALVRACQELCPGLPQVAVFDTAFHSTIPRIARTYALPLELRQALGLRKYGFHGISHCYVAGEAARLMGIPLGQLNAVSCHLGTGGASLCAIKAGRSVDNTMGYSPLQGLVMSTRSGDLDPALVLRLLRQVRCDAQQVQALLNTRSGVLGLSGASADIRDIIRCAAEDVPLAARARLTLQLYAWRVRKYLGAYLATVGRAHAVIFTDTVGQSVPLIRWMACCGMEAFGLVMAPERNNCPGPLPADVAAPHSAVRVLVIPADEELAIARSAYSALLQRNTR